MGRRDGLSSLNSSRAGSANNAGRDGIIISTQAFLKFSGCPTKNGFCFWHTRLMEINGQR